MNIIEILEDHPYLKHTLKEGELLFNDLMHLTCLVHESVNANDPVEHTGTYWRMCAIQELFELAEEIPWQHWKPSKTVDFTKARLETIDILIFLIYSATIDKSPSYFSNGITDCGYIGTGNYDEMTYTDIDKLIRSIYTLPTKFKCDNDVFVAIANTLCKCTLMDKDMFFKMYLSKLALVSCRYVNGSYRKTWNKVSILNETEAEVIEGTLASTKGLDYYTIIDSLVTDFNGFNYKHP